MIKSITLYFQTLVSKPGLSRKSIDQIAHKQPQSTSFSQYIAILKLKSQNFMLGRQQILRDILSRTTKNFQIQLIFYDSCFLYFCQLIINGFYHDQLLFTGQQDTFENQVISKLEKDFIGLRSSKDILISCPLELKTNSINVIPVQFVSKLVFKGDFIKEQIQMLADGPQKKNDLQKLYVEQMTCPITLQIFELPVEAECKHVFDASVLLAWLKISKKCPYCKLENLSEFRISTKHFRRLINLMYLFENP